MEKEIWKDVKDYEGLYQVSNLGNVKSLYDASHKKYRELIMKPSMNSWGYLQIGLCKNGKQKPTRINRLVAIAFELPIPEHLRHIPIERLEVNHKDEDKTNNCVWNLEWCNSKYNNNYGTHNARVSEALKGVPKTEETKRKMSESKKGVPKSEETKRKMSEAHINGKKSKRVLQLDKNTGEVIRQWSSINEVHRQLGYSQGNISDCCNGKFEQRYGFKWKYA